MTSFTIGEKNRDGRLAIEMTGRKRSCIRATLFFAVLVLAPGPFVWADPSEETQSAAEIQERLFELVLEIQNTTGSDSDRLLEISKEAVELGEALKNAMREEMTRAEDQSRRDAVPHRLPTSEEPEAVAADVRESLQGREDEACYVVLYQAEYTRRYTGFEFPFIACVPLEIRLTWTIEERLIRTGTWPTGITSYVLEETYPGYLRLHYDPHDRRIIESLEMVGPSPVDDSRVGQRLVSAEGSGLLAYDIGPSHTKVVGARDKGAFELNSEGRADQATTNFRYDRLSGEHSGVLVATRVMLPAENVVERPYLLRDGMPYAMSELIRGVHFTLSLDEVIDGLREGRLARELPADVEEDYRHHVSSPHIYRRSGSVQLEVLFNTSGSSLEVEGGRFYSRLQEKDRVWKPSAKTYKLTNTGVLPLQYEVSSSAGWLNFENESGTIGPLSSTTVPVAVATGALDLDTGIHEAKINFSNITNTSELISRDAVIEIKPQIWQAHAKGYEYVRVDKKHFADLKQRKWVLGDFGLKYYYDVTGRFKVGKKEGRLSYLGGEVVSEEVTVGGYSSIQFMNWLTTEVVSHEMSSKRLGGGFRRSLPADTSPLWLTLNWPKYRVEAQAKFELTERYAEQTESGNFARYSYYEFPSEVSYLGRILSDLSFPLVDGTTVYHTKFSPIMEGLVTLSRIE